MSFLSGLFGGGSKQDTTFSSVAKNKLDAANNINNGNVVNTAANGGSLSDILAAANGTGNQDASLENLASSVGGGSALASQQVMNNPLLSGLLGAGGSRDQALAQEQQQATSGYQLQPSDYDAMGQASGNIARQFGGQEQSLASSLAARGLGAGNSGASQASFSGLNGNKYEQLGQMQQQIAQQRVQNNMNQLAQTRSYLSQLGQLGNNAQGQQYNQNQTEHNQQQQQYGTDVNQYSAQQNATNQAAQNQQSGLGDALTGGLMAGLTGGTSALVGAGAGSLGSSLFGSSKPAASNASNVPSSGGTGL